MNSVRLDPASSFKRDPLPPYRMRDRLTSAEDAMILCHLGVPRIEQDAWSLHIDGMVERPLSIAFAELLGYPQAELTAVHQCCGSPLSPFEPTRRVSNVRWTGARLTGVLAACRPIEGARYLWSYGADHGEFGGIAVDAFVKDLPVARVAEEVLIAYKMNGQPLTAEQGFPARLVVPGYYGTNSVKWLARITLAAGRSPGPFTTRWYNDPVLDGTGRETGQTVPVWSIAPESLIVSPEPDARLRLNGEHEIWGWAWADGGVRRVYVRAGDSEAWQPAVLEPPHGRAWQRFSFSWKPSRSGEFRLSSIAEAANGLLQPTSGRRNALYELSVSVAD
jgi:DMSO/TMAO reductase YedYZ molybdopterin-dependent catalytic subunit